jgi:DNA-binding CsgD family transcriptional regulator
MLRLTAEGLTEADIAALLFISTHSVKQHRGDMRRNLGARTLPHAVAIGYQRRILQVPDA